MPQERLVMMTPLSKKKEKGLNYKLNLAVGMTVDSPHVTFGDEFIADLDKAKTRLDDYFSTQDPYTIPFDTLDFYKDVVFLKPSDVEISKRIEDLFYDSVEFAGGRPERKQNLTPHITLIKSPFLDHIRIKEEIEKVFDTPILVPINSIALFRNVTAGGWQKVANFEIGTNTEMPYVPKISMIFPI